MKLKIVGLLLIISMFPVVPISSAHQSGCHTLHSCPSDSDTYDCGDLGYPCDGSTSINDVLLEAINVPLLVEKVFEAAYGRKPSDEESSYWKDRFRTDKGSIYKLRRTISWHKGQGSFGPKGHSFTAPSDLIIKVNSIFRSAYMGRNPTESENRYWLSRIKEKVTVFAMKDAMLYHRFNGIKH